MKCKAKIRIGGVWYMGSKSSKCVMTSVSDFSTRIKRNLYYVDKTLFIKELLDENSRVSLILRPRRFGKTLNMSMLKYFFDCTENGAILFNGLNISKYPECMKYQGQYAVISLALDTKIDSSWSLPATVSDFRCWVSDLYEKYSYLMDSPALTKGERNYISKMMQIDYNDKSVLDSLRRLSYFLYRHFNCKTVLLIDGYDIPFQVNFVSEKYRYSRRLMQYIGAWLSNALNNNPYLEFAILDGNFEVSKRDLLGRLKDIKVYGILDEQFSQYFGLSDNEVKVILSDFECLDKYDTIKSWYGGYKIGKLEVYNPFSVFSFIEFREKDWYSNSILRYKSKFNSKHFQQAFKLGYAFDYNMIDLLKYKFTVTSFDLEVLYGNRVDKSRRTLYGVLVQAGYLRVDGIDSLFRDCYRLSVPNQEIMLILKHEIGKYLINTCHFYEIGDIYVSLVNKNWDALAQSLSKLTIHSLNYGTNSNRSTLILCLLCGLGNAAQVEAKYRMYLKYFNITITSCVVGRSIILINFKHSSSIEELEEDAMLANKSADEQLNSIEYGDAELVVIYGISFYDKQVYVAPYRSICIKPALLSLTQVTN